MAPDRPRYVVGSGYLLRVGPNAAMTPVDGSVRLVISGRGTFALGTEGERRSTLCLAAAIPAGVSFSCRGAEAISFVLFLDAEGEAARRLQMAATARRGSAGWEQAARDVVDVRARHDLAARKWAAAARRILGHLVRSETRLGSPAVDRTIATIEAQLAEPLFMTSLGGRVGMLPEQLSGEFLRAVGLPLTSYIFWSRLQRFAKLVHEGEDLAGAAHQSRLGTAARFRVELRRRFGFSDAVADWQPAD